MGGQSLCLHWKVEAEGGVFGHGDTTKSAQTRAAVCHTRVELVVALFLAASRPFQPMQGMEYVIDESSNGLFVVQLVCSDAARVVAIGVPGAATAPSIAFAGSDDSQPIQSSKAAGCFVSQMARRRRRGESWRGDIVRVSRNAQTERAGWR